MQSQPTKLKSVREEDVPERKPSGLKDGGHIYLECSGCRAILMDIWVTNPSLKDPSTNKPFEWKIKANCPFCNDHSFPLVVKGGFHYGGYGKVKADNEDDDVPSTVVENGHVSGDAYVFNIIKASENAKPIKSSRR